MADYIEEQRVKLTDTEVWYLHTRGYCVNCGEHWSNHGAVTADCPDESGNKWKPKSGPLAERKEG